ncbi:MAG TPA: hypothetical protein PLN24_05195 [Victivallales bacterium]|nr:hypothetical protein [Victivallales bacterium]
MSSHNFFIKTKYLFICLFSFFLCLRILGGPTIERASLRTGFSPRVKDYSWVELRITVKNPDLQSKELLLRLAPEDSFFSAKRTTFEYILKVPAKAELDYTTEAIAEGADSFKIELFEKGSRVNVSDNFLIEKVSGGRTKKMIAVLNDSDEISLGAINQLNEYKKNLFISTLSATHTPFNFSLFLPFDTLIILKPDFKDYTQQQFKAILDYVCGGGKVVFADPEAIIEAASTPLAVLLPVIPITLKKINNSESLKKLFENFTSWKEQEKYIDFLDSIPKNDSYVFAKEKDSPLFSMKKYGLGTIIASAIPLTEEVFKNTSIWKDIVKFAFINELPNESYSETVNTLDSLTGFSIPSTVEIGKKLIIILIPILTLISVGVIFRNAHLTWAAIAIFAVIMTFRIFSEASSTIKQGKQLLLASLDTLYTSNGNSLIRSKYSLFSKKDITFNLTSKSLSALFSGIPPETIRAFPSYSGTNSTQDTSQPLFNASISEPILVRKINGLAKITDLQVKANASKKFQQLDSFYKGNQVKIPTISYSDREIYLDNVNLSDFNEKPDSAAIIMPGGIAELKIENNQIKGGKLNFNNTQNPFLNSIKKENPSSFPFLALIFKNDSSEYMPSMPEENQYSGNCIKALILPIQENFTNQKIFIPFELTNILIGDNSTRMFADNPREFSVLVQDDNEYRFKFRIPPQCVFIKPESIELKFEYIAESTNIDVIPYLASTSLLQEENQKDSKASSKNKKSKNTNKDNNPNGNYSQKIKYTEQKGNIFILKME